MTNPDEDLKQTWTLTNTIICLPSS